MTSELDLAASLFGSRRLETSNERRSSSATSTLYGTAVSDSADGSVDVVIDGGSVSAAMPDGTEGDNVLTLATSPAVKEGDTVLITAVGGASKQMTVTAVVASGDRNRDQAVVSTLTEYAESTDPAAAPTSGWSEDAPAFEDGKYVWMRQTVTYGSGRIEVGEPVVITGNTGKGIKGDNAYLHIAYATSADGREGFSVDDPEGKSYIGQYTDAEEEDSTDPARYAWTRIKGQDATLLHIDSSRGTVFKNADGSTVFTVTIFHGDAKITDKAGLTSAFGAGAYLEWKWLKADESDWGTIPASDSRLSNDGFTLAITSEDVDVKTSFECNLNY